MNRKGENMNWKGENSEYYLYFRNSIDKTKPANGNAARRTRDVVPHRACVPRTKDSASHRISFISSIKLLSFSNHLTGRSGYLGNAARQKNFVSDNKSDNNRIKNDRSLRAVLLLYFAMTTPCLYDCPNPWVQLPRPEWTRSSVESCQNFMRL